MNAISLDMRLNAAFSGGERITHVDPRARLIMLYGVWVKCLPHQAGRRKLVEASIERCKAQIAWNSGLISEAEARRRMGCAR